MKATAAADYPARVVSMLYQERSPQRQDHLGELDAPTAKHVIEGDATSLELLMFALAAGLEMDILLTFCQNWFACKEYA